MKPAPLPLATQTVLKHGIVSIFYGITFLPPTSYGQNSPTTGTIRDASGTAIPGASVKIRGTKAGASTDSSGKFNLTLKNNAVLDVSAIGFNDTSVVVNGQNNLTIVLMARQNSLQDVSVNSSISNVTGFDPVVNSRIIQDVVMQYALVANISNGVFQWSDQSGHYIRFGYGPQNTLNTGVLLPSFMPKGETRGSRYLLNGFAGGVVIDSGNNLIKNNAPIYNYDKISGTLIIRKDAQKIIEVGKAEVKAFALKSGDTSYVFTQAPALGKDRFFAFIGAGPKYAVFKQITTKFIKSNYTNNGLIESGNNYDAYVDEYVYYLVNIKEAAIAPAIITLKKKAIKEAFSAAKPKIDEYFSLHKNDDVDEAFVKGLVEFIN